MTISQCFGERKKSTEKSGILSSNDYKSLVDTCWQFSQCLDDGKFSTWTLWNRSSSYDCKEITDHETNSRSPEHAHWQIGTTAISTSLELVGLIPIWIRPTIKTYWRVKSTEITLYTCIQMISCRLWPTRGSVKSSRTTWPHTVLLDAVSSWFLQGGDSHGGDSSYLWEFQFLKADNINWHSIHASIVVAHTKN